MQVEHTFWGAFNTDRLDEQVLLANLQFVTLLDIRSDWSTF